MKIGLISCTKTKQDYNCHAWRMYFKSALFRKAFKYCQENCNVIYILSAKHGLIPTSKSIMPYDTTLKSMNKYEKNQWNVKVVKQIQENFNKHDELYFHAGKEYCERLTQILKTYDYKCFTPLHGLTIGRRLRWYNEKV